VACFWQLFWALSKGGKGVRSEYSLFFTCDDIVLSHRLALQVWLGQLTADSTAGPQWGLSFTYDGFGNRTAQSVTKGSGPTVSLSINPASNRINSSGYTYDANGNLTAMPNSTFLYDIENRLVKVTSSGTSEYYGHDPWNRRVWKTTTTSGTGKVFFYGVFGELMGTYSFSGSFSKVETNLHFGGKLIRWDNVAVVLDRLGGVKLRSNVVVDPPVTQKSNYYPFGEERTATPQDRTKFATYYRDNKTGFDYAMNRYYNSSWGRFTTADPFGGSVKPANPLSWNRYAYVANDPINNNDPSGLNMAFWDPDWGGGGGGFNPFNPGEPCPWYAGCGWDVLDNWWNNNNNSGPYDGPRNGGVPPPKHQRLFHDDLVKGADSLIDKSECSDFLVDVAQTAFLTIANVSRPDDLDPGSRPYYDAITATNMEGRLQAASFTDAQHAETDKFGNIVNARSDYGKNGTNQSVTFFDSFFGHSKKEQYQITVHESMHLIFAFGDSDLARAAGVYTGDENASANFQKELQKHCK
jgi:RHS repeat-associated protein